MILSNVVNIVHAVAFVQLYKMAPFANERFGTRSRDSAATIHRS